MKPLLILCLAMPAMCQPAFTVASLRVTDFLPDKAGKITIHPDRLNITGLTLQTLIARAYGVGEFQVRGANEVLHERYTIAATMPAETTQAVVWQMVQALLTERLHLKLRRAREEMPVYALHTKSGAGPQLKASAGGEVFVRFRGGAIDARNVTMQDLANLLGGLFDRPVIDQTGLDGAYDLKLGFTPDATLGHGMSKMSVQMELAEADTGGQSIFGALQQQLGLKLEARKLPVEVLVVDGVLKTPVEN